MTTLLDDQALSQLLRGTRKVDGPVFTTGLWYVRLCQAAVNVDQPGKGQLSGPLTALPPAARAAAIRAIVALPDSIGMLSFRQLAPAMAQLRERHQLNLLSMEALASARELEAKVILTAPSPRLAEALEFEGLVTIDS